MSSPKQILRSITPPILWASMHALKSSFGNQHPTRSWFEGPIPSWAEAIMRSDGWDAAVITSKTLESALQVRDGLAEFERDGVVQRTIVYSNAILTGIIFALSSGSKHLRVIDFGGGLGTGYFQNRKILQHLPSVSISWHVVERPDLATLGSQHFERPDLHFSPCLDVINANLEAAPDLFIFSGSFQFIVEPLTLLDQLINIEPRVLVFDRLLVAQSGKHAIFIQHPPATHYPATYPTWCFAKDLFIEQVIERGFNLIDEFPGDPESRFDHCSMVFVRGHKSVQ
jgi:putative methyltransferase (TIGR04325 family)